MNKQLFPIIFLFLACFYGQTTPVTRGHLENVLKREQIKINTCFLSVLYHLNDDELEQISEELLLKVITFMRPLSDFLALQVHFVEQTRFKLFGFIAHLMPAKFVKCLLNDLPEQECRICGELVKEIFENTAKKLFLDLEYFEIKFDAEFNFGNANIFFEEFVKPGLETIFKFVKSPAEMDFHFDDSSPMAVWFWTKVKCVFSEVC